MFHFTDEQRTILPFVLEEKEKVTDCSEQSVGPGSLSEPQPVRAKWDHL